MIRKKFFSRVSFCPLDSLMGAFYTGLDSSFNTFKTNGFSTTTLVCISP